MNNKKGYRPVKKIIIAVLLALTFSFDAFPGYRRGPTLETEGTLQKKARIENVDENYAAYIVRKDLRTLKGPTRFGKLACELDPQDVRMFPRKKQTSTKCKKATPMLNHKENDEHKEKVARYSIIEAQNYLQSTKLERELRQIEKQRQQERDQVVRQVGEFFR